MLFEEKPIFIVSGGESVSENNSPNRRTATVTTAKVMPIVYLLHSEMVQPDWMLTTDNTYSRTHNAKCGNVAAEWKEKNGKIEGNKTHVGRVKITVEWTN